MPRAGRDLERIIALIESQLHGKQGVTVQSPSSLQDVDSGTAREFDVVITFAFGHHALKVAVECKAQKAEVDSATVGAFSEKCNAAGVHSAVIVSSSGFTRPALLKAEKKHVRCLTLGEAAQFDWCLCAGVIFQQPEILDGYLECLAEEPIAQPYKVYWDDDSELTGEQAGRIASSELGKYLPPRTIGGPHRQVIQYGPQGGYVVGADGKRQRISGLKLWLIYQVNERLIPLEFFRYGDSRSGEEIASAARAKFEIGEATAELTMLKKPDAGIDVLISHRPKAA